MKFTCGIHNSPNMILVGLLSSISFLVMVVESTYHVEVEKKCNCFCKEGFVDAAYADKPICHRLSRFEKDLVAVKEEMMRRTAFINNIKELRDIMEEHEDLLRDLQQQIKSLNKVDIANEVLPTPASLIRKPDDYMLGDSNLDTRMKEDKELANNVSNLLEKVAEVENLTSKFHEELRSERRVRRHLEEDLNETRTSIKLLDDKLHNVTLPMDDRVTHVEEIVLSTIENMNKTLYDDHLKKLYYRVDGVVYRNETQKLDERLDQMEAELMDVSNANRSLKLEDELKSLTGTVSSLNQTIIENLATEKLRLDNLEKDFHKLKEFEGIDDLMSGLLNASELMHSGVSDLWNEVQNVQNVTSHLEKKVYNQTVEHSNAIEIVKLQLSEKLDNLTEDLSSTKDDVLKAEETLSTLQRDVQLIAADVAVSENKLQELTIASYNKIKDVHSMIDNLTDIWDSSLSSLAVQIVEWKNSKEDDVDSSTSSEQESLDIDGLPNEPSEESDPEDIDPLSRLRIKGVDKSTCSVPQVNDTHLLVSMDFDSEGRQRLVFHCRPVGRYAVSEEPVPIQCVNGAWRGTFPTCNRLLEENEVKEISREQQMSNPCTYNSGEIPDPTDCSYFFKCWHGRASRFRCPQQLHFNARERKCDYPIAAQCIPYITSQAERLRELIPTILIDPDNVDKPFGLMGTDGTGHLVVYPGTSFELHCLFPESQWGPPEWHATLSSVGLPNKMTAVQIKNHRTSVRITAISPSYSGIYSCISPFGKKNHITIVVKAVSCPPIQLESKAQEAVLYRKHPDGEYRIMSTTAEFSCDGNFAVTAVCLPDGTWSRPPPNADECPLKRPQPMTLWGCPVINTESEPDLILERDDRSAIITFKCGGNNRLIGQSFTTCYDGSWSHYELPKCSPLTF